MYLLKRKYSGTRGTGRDGKLKVGIQRETMMGSFRRWTRGLKRSKNSKGRTRKS